MLKLGLIASTETLYKNKLPYFAEDSGIIFYNKDRFKEKGYILGFCLYPSTIISKNYTRPNENVTKI